MLKTLKKQVEYCLQNFPDTRNDDCQLLFTVIYEFAREEMIIQDNKWFVSTTALKKYREDHIKRLRARFNEKGLYWPTDEQVIKKRGLNEEKWRVELGFNPELRKVY